MNRFNECRSDLTPDRQHAQDNLCPYINLTLTSFGEIPVRGQKTATGSCTSRTTCSWLAAPVRAPIARQLGWLGLLLDDDASAHHGPRIGAPESRISAWVIATDEESVIARQVWSMTADT